METRDNFLLRMLGQRDQLTPDEVQQYETEYQEVLAAHQRVEAIEEKAHAEGIEFAIEGVDFTKLDAETAKLINIIVRADRRRIYNEHAIELEQLETEKTELMKANNSFAETFTEMSAELAEARKTHLEYVNIQQGIVHDLDKRIADAESKRDAAVQKLEEQKLSYDVQENFLKGLIGSLEAKIAEYEQADEFRQRQEKPVTDISISEADEIKAAIAAINKKKYVQTEDWGSVIKATLPDGSFEMVKRKELESEWESADIPESPVEAVVQPEMPIRFQDAHDAGGLVGDTVVPEGVQDHDGRTVEERLNLLELAVFGTRYVDVA